MCTVWGKELLLLVLQTSSRSFARLQNSTMEVLSCASLVRVPVARMSMWLRNARLIGYVTHNDYMYTYAMPTHARTMHKHACAHDLHCVLL
jgi:hypothetical protein